MARCQYYYRVCAAYVYLALHRILEHQQLLAAPSSCESVQRHPIRCDFRLSTFKVTKAQLEFRWTTILAVVRVRLARLDFVACFISIHEVLKTSLVAGS